MSFETGPVRWGILRRKVRIERRKLRAVERDYLDDVVADIYKEAGTEEEFKQFFTAKSNADSATYGFDPMTIILLIELAMLIYKLLKHFDVLAPTPEFVSFMIDEDE